MIELGRNFVASILSSPDEWKPKAELIPVEQITPQRIAQIILEQREPTSEEIRRTEEIFNGTFDITHVRIALNCPEADQDDFHKRYPRVNQALRVALRILYTQGALYEDFADRISKKPNDNGELFVYKVTDSQKLEQIAQGAATN